MEEAIQDDKMSGEWGGYLGVAQLVREQCEVKIQLL